MTTKTVELGATANVAVSAAFAQAEFPLALTVENRLPRPVVFPDIRVSLGRGQSVEGVIFKSFAELQRFASGVAQLARLNRCQVGAALVQDVPEPEPLPEPVTRGRRPKPKPEPEPESPEIIAEELL